jgi:DNA replicative helicase MCM subunit Mcm2 (Cdc46/Mcm family)
MWQPAERSRYGFKSSETPESNEMRVLQDLILRISGYHAIGVQTDVLVRKAGEMGIPEFRARHLIDKLIEQGTVIKPLEGFLKPAQNVIQSR